jgi:GNAT superfamily N-acetyltransferase
MSVVTAPRPATAEDLDALAALHALCHPTWGPRPELWWFAHPTLVLEEDGQLIGSTSFSVAYPPTVALARLHPAEIGYGHGVSVHPGRRGQGLGWTLAEARHAVLRALGITFFIGQTQPDNAPMLAIFARQGLAASVRIAKAYPDGTDGVLYLGSLT